MNSLKPTPKVGMCSNRFTLDMALDNNHLLHIKNQEACMKLVEWRCLSL